MRVCLDIRPCLKSSSTGIGKFTFALLKALRLILEEKDEIVLYYKKRKFDFKKKLPKIKDSNVIYWNTKVKKNLPRAEIYLSSSYDFQPSQEGKFIFILHDLIPLVRGEFSSLDAKEIIDKFLSRRLEEATAVVCISRNTLDDLLKFYPHIKNKTYMIYPAVDYAFKKIENKNIVKNRLQKLGIRDKYILFVSSLEPRKNLLSLLKAFPSIKEEFPELKLVVAGKKIKSYSDLECYLKSYPLSKEVLFLGYVEDETLLYLYNGAEVFVFPSFYEGFGLPIIEAFLCGVAVVTSDTSSLKEIAGDSAEFVNPWNEKDIVRGIVKVLKDEEYREKLISSARERAKKFNLNDMSLKYKRLLREVLEK